MEFPLVTIFTLIYNTNPKYVIEAIESVRNNNYPNIQHIIIDDCSPDTTPKKVVKQWIAENNYPCEFHEHEVNFGLCKTLNHVLDLTKGKYLIGCSDDVLLENRIIDDVTIFESLPEDYCMIHSITECFDEHSKSLNREIKLNSKINDDEYFVKLIHGNFISAPTVTLKTNILKKIGGYDEKILFEDYDMWLRLSSNGYKFKYHDKINTRYRIHAQSMSNSTDYEQKKRMFNETRKIVMKNLTQKNHIFMYHDFQIINKHNELTLLQLFESIYILINIKRIKLIHFKCLFKTIFNY
jgi:glycosyltransferase involved in cell wall biosynthesis